MLYIQIPEGMVFQKLKFDDETEGDYFVSMTDPSQHISIQAAVYEFLTSHDEQGNVMNLLLSKRRLNKGNVLEYRTNQNGLLPTEYYRVKEAISSVSVPGPASVSLATRPAWFAQTTPLTESRRNKLEEKRKAQREDRRHIGDSPKAT